MSGRTRRSSSSIYDFGTRPIPKESHSILYKKIHPDYTQLTFGIVIGGILTLSIILLHCLAVLTPHWKEISPNAHSVYVDGVDALIRTEILVYFNSVHRFTRHSYGLFQRCEYRFGNLTRISPDRSENLNIPLFSGIKKCTKNYLPSYSDDKLFNECHSLQYYRFCSKTSGRIFDISNDYLRDTFDITVDTIRHATLSSSCDCSYPEYVTACQVFSIIALICLSLLAFVYVFYPFLKTRHQCMKYKCIGVVSWIFAMISILINLLVFLSYLDYESLEYVTAIERHYRSSQIYSLSQDAKTAIERFRSSIKIETGYSAKIAWAAFALAFIDGILLLFVCEVKNVSDEISFKFLAKSDSDQCMRADTGGCKSLDNDSTLAEFLPVEPSINFSPVPSLSHSIQPSTRMASHNSDEQSNRPLTPPRSCLKRTSTPQVCFQEEV